MIVTERSVMYILTIGMRIAPFCDSLSSEQFTWGKGSETDQFAKLGFRQEEISLNSLK